jgi:probable phosphoglycerate mutase
MTLLYLVRHGETDWNLERRIQGSTDIKLNATGRAQAAATGALLARRSWDAIYASPLSRAFETASIIAAANGLPLPTAVPELVERNYGEAEGMTGADIDKKYPRNAEVPGRESRDAVTARVLPALLAIAEHHHDEAVIVVSHGGVIRSVLHAAQRGAGANELIRNGSVHSFRHVDGALELIAFDDPIEIESLDYATEELEEQNALEARDSVG